MAARPSTFTSSTNPNPTLPIRPSDPAYPPQLAPGQIAEDEAPPSYEDAMADEISPANGPRREYSGVTDVNAPGLDEKGGEIGMQSPRYEREGGGSGKRRGGVV